MLPSNTTDLLRTHSYMCGEVGLIESGDGIKAAFVLTWTMYVGRLWYTVNQVHLVAVSKDKRDWMAL